MENKNNPPFAIGQKVVCLVTMSNLFLNLHMYKDSIYTCAGCEWLECCNRWMVYIAEFDIHDSYPHSCSYHPFSLSYDAPRKYRTAAKYLAPIQGLKVSEHLSIEKDLLKPQVEETLDVIRETVN